MLRSSSKQSGKSIQLILKERKERLRFGGFAEKEGFKPRVKE